MFCANAVAIVMTEKNSVAHDEHGPAADLVGEHAEHERADEHAEVRRDEHRPRARSGDVPLGEHAVATKPIT